MADNLVLQIGQLRRMTVGDLREKYREVFGQETRSRNKDWLFKRVAWGLQELRHGGLSARARAKELAEGTAVRTRAPRGTPAHPIEPRLPSPGTIIEREHGGVRPQITVLDDGFEYQGHSYRSLSRSLLDFARLIDTFDKRGIAEVARRAKDTAAVLDSFDELWEMLVPEERLELVRLLVARIDVNEAEGTIEIHFHDLSVPTPVDGPSVGLAEPVAG